MAEQTKIEWADSTLNLQMGCDGCELWTATTRMCYAGTLTERYGGRPGWPDSFAEPKLFLERLDKALKWKDLSGTERADKPWLNGLPRMIFLNDMGDTFTESLPIDWLAPLLPRMADSPHIYLLLTKRAARMRQFSEAHYLPPNVWPGVSVTSQLTARRMYDLVKVVGGGPKWVSAEPLLGRVDLSRWLYPWDPLTGPQIAWCIVGGESGPGARRCVVENIRQLNSQCRSTGAASFNKQLGSNPIFSIHDGVGRWNPQIKDSKGGDWEEWPEDLRVREVPRWTKN